MASNPANRKLLAIMFTDMVGYTKLIERDETAAVHTREKHREIVSELVLQFDGNVIDATGDESLSVFPSAVLAADCALAIQRDAGKEERLSVRIGINLGDVIQSEGEVVGAAVNLAARVRPFAEPGGICITDAVRRAIRGVQHLEVHDMGLRSLKNVEGPVHLFTLLTPDSTKRPWWRRTVTVAIWIPSWALLLLGLILAGAALYLSLG